MNNANEDTPAPPEHEIKEHRKLDEELSLTLVADPLTAGTYAMIWPSRIGEADFLKLAARLLGSAPISGGVFTDLAAGKDDVGFESWEQLQAIYPTFEPDKRCFYLITEELSLVYYPPGSLYAPASFTFRAKVPTDTMLLLKLMAQTAIDSMRPDFHQIIQWVHATVRSAK